MRLPPALLSAATWARLARLGVGGGLLALAVEARHLPRERLPTLVAALAWPPLLWATGALGVFTLVALVGEAAWARWGPAAGPPRWGTARLGLATDALVVALLGWGGITAHAAWRQHANPDAILSGYDYNTYVLNAAAVKLGEWGLYTPDKHVFHARVVAWLDRGDLATTLVTVSMVSMGLQPAVTYVLGRVAGGGFAALLAAVLTFSVPLGWFFSAQTTAYPFFFLVVVAALTSGVAALQRPSVPRVVLAALLAGVAASTQEKTPVVLAPVFGLALLLGAPAAWGALRARPGATLARAGALLALAGGIVAGVLYATAPPMPYTPFVSLVTNQREEMHREVPYEWPVVKNPDLDDPAGLRRWLPRPLWDGAVESWVAGALTPPDSNALRLARDPVPWGVKPWSVVPDTTLAPLEMRLAASHRGFLRIVGPLPQAGLVLLGVGAASLLVLARGRARMAASLVGAVATGLAPLGLKFYETYFPHLIPVVAVLSCVGLDHLVRALLPGRWAWGGRVMLAGVTLAYALALWTDNANAWRAPIVTFPPPAAVVPPDPDGYGLGLRRVATWLAAQDHPEPIVDCLPGSMVMMMSADPRISHDHPGRACTQGLAAAQPGQWLLVSDHGQFPREGIPKPAPLLSSGAWRVVYGWAPRSGEVGTQRPAGGWRGVLVLEATGTGE